MGVNVIKTLSTRFLTVFNIINLVFGLPYYIPERPGSGISNRHQHGDLVFPKDSTRSGVLGTNWPDGIIPYIIDSNILDEPGLLGHIIGSQEDISANTCIKFRHADPNNDTYWLRYRVDKDESECSTYLGFQDVPDQDMNLYSGCTKSEIIHETLHVLGFLHEHGRNDRDNYIKIIYDNIVQSPTNHTYNFLRDEELGYATDYYDVPYNYESIMHYLPNAYSINSSDPELNTIEAIPQKDSSKAIGDPAKMGQSKTLSQGDIQMIRKKYFCPSSGNVDETTDIDEYSSTAVVTYEPETTEAEYYQTTTTEEEYLTVESANQANSFTKTTEETYPANPGPGAEPTEEAYPANPGPGAEPTEEAYPAYPGPGAEPTEEAYPANPGPGAEPTEEAYPSNPGPGAEPTETTSKAPKITTKPPHRTTPAPTTTTKGPATTAASSHPVKPPIKPPCGPFMKPPFCK